MMNCKGRKAIVLRAGINNSLASILSYPLSLSLIHARPACHK